jgi:hypothetical protein
MNSSIGLVLKVMLLSLGIALMIKQAAPALTIAPTPAILLSALLLPSVGMGIALSWRGWQQRLNPSKTVAPERS